MGGDVTVRFGADISELKKAQAEAGKSYTSIVQQTERLQKSTAKLNNTLGRSGQGLKKAGDAGRQAQFAMPNLNRVVQDAPFGFIAIQNNIDQAAASLVSLARTTGGARGALSALAASFTGPAGIITLISLASSLYLAFGDDIAAAFSKGTQAANDYRDALNDAIENTFTLQSGLDDVAFDSRNAVLEAIRQLDSEISEFEQRQAAVAPIVTGGAGGAQVQQRTAEAEKLGRLEAETLKDLRLQRDALKEQLIIQEAQFKVNQAARNLGANVQGRDVRLRQDSGLSALDELVPDTLTEVQDDLKAFEQRRLDAAKASIELSKAVDKVSESLERENQQVQDAILRDEQRVLQQDKRIANEQIIANNTAEVGRQIDANNEALAAEAALFATVGDVGVGVLDGLIFKFEEATDAAGKLRNALRSIGSRLLNIGLGAVVNAGIGSITGNPLSFGEALAGAAGIKLPNPLDTGSANRGSFDTPVIGGAQKVEVTAARVTGGDLLFSIQEAQRTRGVGGINLS